MPPEFRCIFLLPVLLLGMLLQGCATSKLPTEPAPNAAQQRIDELSLALMALGDDIDNGEARRAASIAIEYPLVLARQYQVSNPPLVHNILVNLGVKPRGLCVDWTADLMTRLYEERFRSFELHWAVANYESAFRIEHSTVVISARGDSLQQGLVLDPWRYSGHTFWARTPQDAEYDWQPHADVQALKRQRKQIALNQKVAR
ncbi:MAG: hypothetical protein GY815_05735 [Gammaproteobacteria bacterium]|nr:hypothetical protein [Gammaproteobacteria bacterium]